MGGRYDLPILIYTGTSMSVQNFALPFEEQCNLI
jgi:hypothetical protein